MDTSDTAPISRSILKEEDSKKDAGQDAFDELMLLSQGITSQGMETSDDDDDDDDGVDTSNMSHAEWVACTL